MKNYLVTAFVRGKNTFIGGKNITFQIQVEISAGDIPEGMAEIFLDSILAKDTERSIENITIIDL